MKYAKMLALAAIVTSALMALIGAGTASATVLCSTTADPCPKGQDWPVGTVFDWSLLKETSLNQVNTAGETLQTCTNSTMKAEITKTGGGAGAAETVTAQIQSTTWGACTFATNTLKSACIEIHKVAGTSNGTVTSDKCTGGAENTEITSNTVLFGSCIYTVQAGKSLGDITEGTPAVLHINAVATKVSGSAFACPETSKWTATYTLTSPAGTTLSVSSS